jgi:hypothetical protein
MYFWYSTKLFFYYVFSVYSCASNLALACSIADE